MNPVALGKTRAKQFALLKQLFGISVSSLFCTCDFRPTLHHFQHEKSSPQAQADANVALAEHLQECYPGDKAMCVQMHGDASFTGQGVVMEGLGLSKF